MEFTINIAAINEVTKRDGSVVEFDLALIPSDLLSDFLVEGVSEYIRDSSSTALYDSYCDAHNGDEGDTTKRKEWGSSNVPAIAKASVTLMTNAIARLYEGERASRKPAEPIDPRVLAGRSLTMDWFKAGETAPARKAFKAYKAIPADDQAARMAYRDAVYAESFVLVNNWKRDQLIALGII